ncbi:hypothetical protein GCM10011609_17640 [Lentzea pudingi]|uniref:Ricin B lectin domain-containing protein n=1 Tax=Lentzea pudingi TaxID=1789439 RepID=A0ABQ2HIX8_9PSEU|nr:hypothetical protein [Lentzea pudingi]GGM82159.1 hypothetical protein GCM10011609_17640 [Lentzea pudingi]
MRIIPVLALLSLLLVPVDAAAAPNGNYYLQSAVTGQNAAVSGSSVQQHRPKGNEDRQQFSWNGSILSEGGQCLGRSGDAAQMVSCSSPEAQWVGLLDDQDRYRFKDPGADRYLIASGTDQVRVGTGNDTWFLTPVTPVRVQTPADPRLDEMTFLTSHNAYANGVDGGSCSPTSPRTSPAASCSSSTTASAASCSTSTRPPTARSCATTAARPSSGRWP